MYQQGPNQLVQTGMTPYPALMPGMSPGGDSLFRILLKGWWLILISTALAAGGAYFYLQRVTPTYTSASSLLIEKIGPKQPLNVPDVGSTSQNLLPTQALLITSSRILVEAAQDPNLLTLPSFAKAENPLAYLSKALSAKAAKNADIITVSAESEFSNDAAQMVNATVKAYIAWHEHNRALSAADQYKDLNAQFETRRKELQAKWEERLRFEERYPEVLRNAQASRISVDSRAIEEQVVQARLRVSDCNEYYEGLKRYEEDPNAFRLFAYGHPASMAKGEDRAKQIQLQQELYSTQALLEEALAAGIVKRSHVATLEDKIVRLQNEIAEREKEFINRHLSLAKDELKKAQDKEKRLTERYHEESGQPNNVGEHDSEYRFLVSECELLQKLCNGLLEQINNFDLNSQQEGLRIHVLEWAVPAMKPSSPQKARILGIGLVAGVMLGAGLAFVRDWKDHSVRSADEITAILGVPVLGAIPKTAKRKLMLHGRRARFKSNSRESEAYRSVRTALFFGASHDKAKTLLVTSPGPLEGKTTLVSNLGVAMAHAGQRTLIIDADLRKPMQQRVFAMNEAGKGLTDMLIGEAGLDEVIRTTDVEGLDVLASGRNVRNPSELLNGGAMASIFEQLRGRYDRILVDSSPVGIVTDAQILANLCDLTLLVLRAKKSSRIITQRARDALATVGASLAGVVVNDVPKRDHRYSHYNGYGAYYSSNGRKNETKSPRRRKSVGVAKDDEVEPTLGIAADHTIGVEKEPKEDVPKENA